MISKVVNSVRCVVLLFVTVLCCVATVHGDDGKVLQPNTAGASISASVSKSTLAQQGNSNFKNDEFIAKHLIPDVIKLMSSRPDEMKKIESFGTFLTAIDALSANGSYQVTREIPFTIIVPKVDTATIEKERLRGFILEHLIPGISFQTFNEDDVYGNANGRSIVFKKQQKTSEMLWTLNNVKIVRMEHFSNLLSAIFIDGILGDKNRPYAKRNIQETNRYNEPQKLEMKNTTKHENIQAKENRISSLMSFLVGMKSGTKVFQHFLTNSNLTHFLDDHPYTVLIPSDNAFQRWHPIDWGFYPFSVQEFTENVLQNHFLQLKTPIRMEDVRLISKELKYKTLGGETVEFRSYPTPSVNNVTILQDYSLPNGNVVMLISEVLFVSEAVVSQLHQMHKDKETPPLLAFPWFGAQFLSHSFLALERDNRFTQITRYLNTAEIAPFVSGSNYTFFVPMDGAFEKLGFDILPDDILASENGVKLLLNHFVKGRLYDRDLKNNEVLETLGGDIIKIHRSASGNVTANGARIVESEIFVYNLGTMFYIDEILHANILKNDITPIFGPTTTGNGNGNGNGMKIEPTRPNVITQSSVPATATTTMPNAKGNGDGYKFSTIPDVEIVPSEYTEQSGSENDFLLDDDEIVTPKALPVRFQTVSPKK